MDTSQRADPLLALGEQILAELGDPRTNNTLVRWLSHHTARLIQEADAARETAAPDADARANDARKAILRLWQARSSWPSGWPPPRAAELARVLEDLSDVDVDPWHQQGLLAHLQDLHYRILAILVDIAVGEEGADIEQGWLNQFGDQLTQDEAALLRRAAARPRHIDPLLDWLVGESGSQPQARDGQVGGDENPPQAHPLLDLANAYHTTIVDLIQGVTDSVDDDTDGV